MREHCERRTVLLASSYANFHLQPLLHGCSALKVLLGCLNVLLFRLLAEIDHVRGEQRLAVQLKVRFISIHHAVQPWQQLLGAVVGVKDNGNTLSSHVSMRCLLQRSSQRYERRLERC
jgi:hypothetical protein